MISQAASGEVSVTVSDTHDACLGGISPLGTSTVSRNADTFEVKTQGLVSDPPPPQYCPLVEHYSYVLSLGHLKDGHYAVLWSYNYINPPPLIASAEFSVVSGALAFGVRSVPFLSSLSLLTLAGLLAGVSLLAWRRSLAP